MSFDSWPIVICLFGGFILVIAYALSVQAAPWDEWDEEGFDQRPGVIRLRRQIRFLFGLGALVLAGGLIGFFLK